MLRMELKRDKSVYRFCLFSATISEFETTTMARTDGTKMFEYWIENEHCVEGVWNETYF